MKKNSVRVFKSSSAQTIENQINTWLHTHKVEIKSIEYAIASDRYSAIILYEE